MKIHKIIKYLEENMDAKPAEGKIKQNKVYTLHDETSGLGKSRLVGDDEIIWSSSLIYVGNLPRDMKENDIYHFVSKYNLKPIKIIKRTNYSLIRVRADLDKVMACVKRINGVFFRGAMVTVNLFERNQNKNKNGIKAQSLDSLNGYEMKREKEMAPGQSKM